LGVVQDVVWRVSKLAAKTPLRRKMIENIIVNFVKKSFWLGIVT
tara:strand:+ start:1571 stop:1702 length:132 start_codon:yes stop_codon:yes gene_type:complete